MSDKTILENLTIFQAKIFDVVAVKKEVHTSNDALDIKSNKGNIRFGTFYSSKDILSFLGPREMKSI